MFPHYYTEMNVICSDSDNGVCPSYWNEGIYSGNLSLIHLVLHPWIICRRVENRLSIRQSWTVLTMYSDNLTSININYLPTRTTLTTTEPRVDRYICQMSQKYCSNIAFKVISYLGNMLYCLQNITGNFDISEVCKNLIYKRFLYHLLVDTLKSTCLKTNPTGTIPFPQSRTIYVLTTLGLT